MPAADGLASSEGVRIGRDRVRLRACTESLADRDRLSFGASVAVIRPCAEMRRDRIEKRRSGRRGSSSRLSTLFRRGPNGVKPEMRAKSDWRRVACASILGGDLAIAEPLKESVRALKAHRRCLRYVPGQRSHSSKRFSVRGGRSTEPVQRCSGRGTDPCCSGSDSNRSRTECNGSLRDSCVSEEAGRRAAAGGPLHEKA